MMGLAILMIYIPTFLVTSIVSIFIGRLIVKIIRRAKTEKTIKTIENKKKIAYMTYNVYWTHRNIRQ